MGTMDRTLAKLLQTAAVVSGPRVSWLRTHRTNWSRLSTMAFIIQSVLATQREGHSLHRSVETALVGRILLREGISLTLRRSGWHDEVSGKLQHRCVNDAFAC